MTVTCRTPRSDNGFYLSFTSVVFRKFRACIVPWPLPAYESLPACAAALRHDQQGGNSLWLLAQGAFMAALYAQGLAWGDMHSAVRRYAARMSSVRHLLQVTLHF